MRGYMQQKIQSVVGDKKPGSPVALGKLPDVEARSCCMPYSAHSPQKNAEVRSDSDDKGACEGARRGRSSAAGSCSIAARVLILPIKFYRRFISPFFPPCCRFTPSCSAYAIEALRKRGFWIGSFLTVWRLLRCHPFCRGGYDPVPDRKIRSASSGNASNVNEEK